MTKYRPKKTGAEANPRGRPMAGGALSECLRRLLDLAPEELAKYRPMLGNEKTAKTLILKAWGLAEKGDMRAISEIFDRCDGRAVQKQVITGDIDEPLVIRHQVGSNGDNQSN